MRAIIRLILCLCLGARLASASTINGFLLDGQGATNRVGVSFKLAKPGSLWPNFIYTSTITTWTTNATFSITLKPGNYGVQIGPSPDVIPIGVPNDSNTYNLDDLIATNLVYAYTFSPLYVQRIGGGGGIMAGNLSFSVTNQAGLIVNQLTTSQRTALTGTNGMIVYDSDLAAVMIFQNGGWTNAVSGGGGSGAAALLLTDTNAFAASFLRLSDTNQSGANVIFKSLAVGTGATNVDFGQGFLQLRTTAINDTSDLFRMSDSSGAWHIKMTHAALTGTNGSFNTGYTLFDYGKAIFDDRVSSGVGFFGDGSGLSNLNASANSLFTTTATNAFAASLLRRSDTNTFANSLLRTGDTNAFANSLLRRADTNGFASGVAALSMALTDTNSFASGIALRNLATGDTNAFAASLLRLADTNAFANSLLRTGDTNNFATGIAARSLATGDTNTFANSFLRTGDTNAFAASLRAGSANRPLAGSGPMAASVSANTVYYLGGSTLGFSSLTTEGKFDIPIQETGTIIGYAVTVNATGTDTATVSYALDYNSGTLIGSASVTWTTAGSPVRTFVTGLSQAVTAGSHVGLKIVTPVWGATPTAVTVLWQVLYSVP